jgi:hypothetical protein
MTIDSTSKSLNTNLRQARGTLAKQSLPNRSIRINDPLRQALLISMFERLVQGQLYPSDRSLSGFEHPGHRRYPAESVGKDRTACEFLSRVLGNAYVKR